LVSALNFYGQHSADLEPEGELPYVYSWFTAIGGAITYVFFFGITVAFAAGLPWRETFALRRPKSWRRALVMMAVASVALLVLSAVVEAFFHAGEAQGVTPDRWVSGHTGAYVANLFVIAGIAPVVEELWFRGLAFSLVRRYGEWLAILTTGLAFGIIHGLAVGLPILIPFGIALAYMRSRLDSVYPGIVLHAAFNAFAILAVLLT
jgi:membrane protease YdiL (CAAX protease family)